MRVGIIGGGITGLALLHACVRRGVEAVAYEADERPGGIIRTRRYDGEVYEIGPQRTRLVPPVRRMVEDLGLGPRLRTAAPGARLYIWARGRLREVPARPSAVMRSDLLTPAGRARLLAEPITSGLRPDESVARFFIRKAGREAYRTLFGPLISATFASDPAVMPARHSLPMILSSLGVRRSLMRAAARWRPGDAPACTFADGMQELVDALAARHEARLRLAAEAVSLERDGTGLRVGFADGSEDRVDRVVLTTPAGSAARLLRTMGDDGVDAAGRLSRLGYNRVAIVSLWADPPQRGFGFQSALDTPWRTRGVTWAGRLFGRGPACTAYLGGGLDPGLESEGDDVVRATAAREFEQIHGAPAEPLAVRWASLPAFDGSWDGLTDLVLPRGVEIASNYTGRLGISARIAQAEAVADGFAPRAV